MEKKPRPQTPHIDVGNSVHISEKKKEHIFRNFSNFMQQIVDNQNENFLNGNVNIIDHLLSKYLGVSVEELRRLEKISINIKGDYGLLNQFGERLQNLKILKLNNSFIQTITDIGTNFKNLKVLEVNNCRLKDLSGIICFENLEVLEAKHNKINDLIELEMCSSITKLDLEDNLIEDEENLLFLGNLDKLTWINLKKNPIKNYEEKLREYCPSLVSIDEESEEKEEQIDVPASKSETLSESVTNNSTNENSELIPTGKKTNSDFFNSKLLGEPEQISLKQEINCNKTINQFNSVRQTQLKPIIMKKEENVQIKSLRESFQTNSGVLNKVHQNSTNNFLLSSASVGNRKRLERLALPNSKPGFAPFKINK